MTARERSPVELGEDLDEIKAGVSELRREVKSALADLLPRELYEARHTALRSEIALELAAIKAQQESDRLSAAKATGDVGKTAEGARAIAMWALGILASAVVISLVGWLATGGGST